MSIQLPSSVAMNSRRKAEAAARRAKLLLQMPSEFNSQELSAVTGLTQKTAQDQLRKMVQWGEVVETSAYKKPRTYRKVTV